MLLRGAEKEGLTLCTGRPVVFFSGPDCNLIVESRALQGSMIMAPLESSAPIMAAPPPLGQVVNLVNPPSVAYELMDGSILLIVLPTVFLIARLCTRKWIVKGLGWDDFWIVCAWVSTAMSLPRYSIPFNRIKMVSSSSSPADTDECLDMRCGPCRWFYHWYVDRNIIKSFVLLTGL
jgi:hypothetical protein